MRVSKTALSTFIATIIVSASLHAAPMVYTTLDTTTQLSPGGYVASSTDLINTGSSTLVSATPSIAGAFNYGGYTILTNGTAGTSGSGPSITDQSTAFGNPSYVTYVLNTSGAASNGYNITDVNSIAGWSDNRAWQNVEVLYATVSAPNTFIPVAITNGNSNGGNSYQYNPVASGNRSTRLRFADSANPGTTPIATNVAAIRIQIFDNGNGNTGGYREWDVFGAAAPVPEPASLGLLATGAAAILLRRKRRN